MNSGNSRTRMVVIAGLGILLVQLAVLLPVRNAIRSGRPDFSSFYAAGRIVLDGNGASLYEWPMQQHYQAQFLDNSARLGALPYGHPPFETLLFALFAWMPYTAAFAAWYACNLLMLFLALRTLYLCVPALHGRWHWVMFATGVFYPVSVTLIQGQDSILLLLLFALVYRKLMEGKDVAAGILLALATFKFPVVLAFAVSIAARRGRSKALQAFAFTCLGLLAVSIVLITTSGIVKYVSFLSAYDQMSSQMSGINPQVMPNLRGILVALLRGALTPMVLKLVFAVLSLCLVIAVAVRWRKAESKDDYPLLFAATTLAGCITAYHFHMHDAVLLILPLLVIANHVASSREIAPFPRRLLVTLAVCAYVVPLLVPTPGKAIALFVVETALFVAVLQLRRTASSRQEHAPAVTRVSV